MDPDSIIEPHESAAATPIAFQFSDVQALAKRILQRAAEQAKRKLDAAGKQAEDIEKAAYDDGFQKGHAEGFAKGEPEGKAAGEAAARKAFQERAESLVPALEALLKELEARKIELRSQAESDLLQLALEIARRIVGREIALDERLVGARMQRAIGLATERSDLVVRAHPQDVEALREELPALHAAFSDLGKVALEADDALARGEIRVQGKEGEVDFRVDQQFEAIERALLGTGAEEVAAAGNADEVFGAAAPPPAEPAPEAQADNQETASPGSAAAEDAAGGPPSASGPAEGAEDKPEPGESPSEARDGSPAERRDGNQTPPASSEAGSP